jgi:hypothetical protein
MVYNREQAAKRAEASKSFSTGMCQLWTRTMYDAPSAGDQDRDNDADAVDGWKSEPLAHRHEGDRRPPRGTPVAFSGGSRGHGHRAISLGNGIIRGTDMSNGRFTRGVVGNATIAQIEAAMGVRYLGWSNTITGIVIPMPPPPAPSGPLTRGPRIDRALVILRRAAKAAKDGTERDTQIKRAIANLEKIDPWRKP